jgi:putative acetyltransferase
MALSDIACKAAGFRAMELRTIQAETAEEIAIARRLIEEYGASLGVDLSFQDFRHEVEGLPGDYAPPRGRLLLAYEDDEAIGCGALRPFERGVCEMKRLYVVPARRRSGAGRILAQRLISEARVIGYRTMRLDTLPGMNEAQRLYSVLGFKEIAAYRYNPISGTQFLELDLVEDAMPASESKRQYKNRPDRKGDWPFSDYVWAGNTCYLSGHLGLEPSAGKPPADVQKEIRLMLDAMKNTLAAAGLEMQNLVSVQVFCSDVNLFATFNQIYREYFSGNFPARAFLGSGRLLFDAHFEIQGIAVKD